MIAATNRHPRKVDGFTWENAMKIFCKQRTRPTFDQLVRFLMKRDGRPAHDAIAHLLSIDDHDRARLEKVVARNGVNVT